MYVRAGSYVHSHVLSSHSWGHYGGEGDLPGVIQLAHHNGVEQDLWPFCLQSL